MKQSIITQLKIMIQNIFPVPKYLKKIAGNAKNVMFRSTFFIQYMSILGLMQIKYNLILLFVWCASTCNFLSIEVVISKRKGVRSKK